MEEDIGKRLSIVLGTVNGFRAQLLGTEVPQVPEVREPSSLGSLKKTLYRR